MQNNELLEMINQLDKQDFELSSDIKLLYDEIKNIEGSFDTSKIEKEIGTLKENISSIQLQKGEKGDKGEKGKDGKDGKNGKDGKDGRNGIDGINGLDGKDGKDGSPDTPEQIVEKINTLENAIERKTIKGLDTVIDKPELDRAIDILDRRTQYLINKTVVAPSATTWASITGTQSDVNVGGFTNDVGYLTSSALSGYVPTSRTITINGTTQDLSANRTWTIAVPTKTSDLTNDSGFITSSALSGYLQNNVGISGGTTLIGGTASGNNLTLVSTSNATKGKILFGTSAYDEVNNRLGIGTNAPSAKLEVRGISDFWGLQVGNGTVGALFQVYGGKAGFVGFNGSAYNSLDIRSGISTQLFLATNGNAGIGTTSPSSPLHVSSSTNSITGRFTGNGISNRVIIEGTGAGISAISFAETNIGSRWGIGSVLSTQAFVISKSGDLGGAGNLALEIGQSTRNMGIQLSGATAKIHIAAGSATAGTAPLKFTSGTNLTTPEAGAIEYDGTSFFGTPSSATRYNFLMNNLGLAGGQTVVGGTASGNNLTFSSTSNATKGKILFGTSAYDEVNDRLGIGTASPAQQLEITKNFQLPNSTATVGNIYKNGALFLHNFGTANVFLGEGTGNLTLSGSYNSAIGFDALKSLTSGGFNMAVGRNALNALTSGTGNVGIGNSALNTITTQNDNVAIGNAALYGTNSVSSVAIGTLAGGALSGTQTGATFIGYGATSSPGGLTNATAIGYNAIVGASNSLVLGGTGSYAVNVGIGQTSPTARLHIAAGTATAGTAPLKFTAGTNLTTPEAGAVEYDGTELYFTPSTTRYKLGQVTAGSSTIASGTYTPTLTGVTNVTSTTAYVCQYMRVGNVVTVSGKIEVTPTVNNAQTTIGVSLPIASNFANSQECGGAAHSVANTVLGHGAAIYADATNDRAEMDYFETHGASDTFSFSFTYQII